MSVLEERVLELIAVGASVSANCLSCVEYHVARAREAGAGTDEIVDAIATGQRVRKGAAATMDRGTGALVAGETASAGGAGCGCAP